MTRRSGNLETSDIGLGCLHLSSRRTPVERSGAIAVIHATLGAGITLLDTADAYTPGILAGRPKQLVASLEASLRHLGIERTDLYQLHRPDPAVPFDDPIGTLGALLTLRDEGNIADTSRQQFGAEAATHEVSPNKSRWHDFLDSHLSSCRSPAPLERLLAPIARTPWACN